MKQDANNPKDQPFYPDNNQLPLRPEESQYNQSQEPTLNTQRQSTSVPPEPATNQNQEFSNPTLDTYSIAKTTTPKKKFKKITLVTFGLILVSFIIGFIVVLSSRNNAVGLSEFTDPNLTMLIPESWSGDAAYKPGSTLLLFYSPEDANDSNREKAYSLTVYVGSSEDRINSQIEGLEDSDAEYTVEADETLEKDGTSIRYVELIVRSKEQPDKEIRVVTVTSRKGDFIINADVVGSSEYWNLHKDVVPTMLKSIIPACEKPNLDLSKTASAAELCK